MLLMLESFDGLGTAAANYDGPKWHVNSAFDGAGVAIEENAALKIHGKYVRGNANSYLLYIADGSAEHATFIAGQRHRGSTDTTRRLFQFLSDTDTTLHVTVGFDAAGRVVIWRGDTNGTKLAESATGVIKHDTWQYVEAKVVLSDSAGSLDIWVDDVAIALTFVTGTNGTQDTKNGGTKTVFDACRVCLAGAVVNSGSLHDDIYVLNGDATAPNARLGDCHVEAIFPNGNGDSSQFTGSDADSVDNYLLVDEVGPDDDTTYVEEATSGEKDLYAFANLTAAGTVHGLIHWTRAKRTDTDGRQFAMVAKSGASETDGADQVLASGYAWYKRVMATKPGGGAWTVSDVNAAQFGVKDRGVPA